MTIPFQRVETVVQQPLGYRNIEANTAYARGHRWIWPVVIHVVAAVGDGAAVDAAAAASHAAEYVSGKESRPSKAHRPSR